MKKPVIGLMLGDATGIGPEISAKLLASGVTNELANVVVIGDKRVLDLGLRNAGVKLGYSVVPSVDSSFAITGSSPISIAARRAFCQKHHSRI